MDQRLVSVRKVRLVMPIPGYPDKAMLTVDGFQIPISNKAKITAGELVLLFKAGTFLPSTTAEFAHLKPQCVLDGVKGFYVGYGTPIMSKGKRLDTFDGRVEPVSSFHDIAVHIRDTLKNYRDEDALLHALRDTEIWQVYLGVVACSPPDVLPSQSSAAAPSSESSTLPDLQPFPAASNNAKGPIYGQRPYFAPKIDMINAQDIASLFSIANRDTAYSVTTFMVGSPMSVYYVRADSVRHAAFLKKHQRNVHNPNHPRQSGRFGVCSRSFDLDPDKTLPQCPHHWAVANQLDLPRKLAQRNQSLVIHGVLCGPDIRDNYEKTLDDTYRFFAYAAVAIDEPSNGNLNVGVMMPVGETTWHLFRQLGLSMVPVHEDSLPLSEIATSHEDILELTDGLGWMVEKRAGLVFRNTQTGRAFKVMSEEYKRLYGEASIRNDTQDKKISKME